MKRKAELTVRILLNLKEEYGDLNRALVLEYMKAYGCASERQAAQDLGLSRSVIRRCLQERSEKNR